MEHQAVTESLQQHEVLHELGTGHLLQGGGGLQNGRGGHVKFYPYEKGGGVGTVLAMLEGGGPQNVLG